MLLKYKQDTDFTSDHSKYRAVDTTAGTNT